MCALLKVYSIPPSISSSLSASTDELARGPVWHTASSSAPAAAGLTLGRDGQERQSELSSRDSAEVWVHAM